MRLENHDVLRIDSKRPDKFANASDRSNPAPNKEKG